jgi:hypothetical protein
MLPAQAVRRRTWKFFMAKFQLSIRCFISEITLVNSRQATDATDHRRLAARDNEK